ncbi:hypothetical protein C3Z06_28325 [Cupriavidus metallidurans]|nr:hypothetical protein C3Z06_28325 [Cupriavidus metallidurans]
MVARAVAALPDDALVDPGRSYLGISKMTLQRKRKDGIGPPFVAMPAGTQYRKGEVDAWVLADKTGMPDKKP